MASLFLGRGKPALALEQLNGTERYPMKEIPVLLRADALEQLGKADSARKLHGSISRDRVFGTEAGFDWLRRIER